MQKGVPSMGRKNSFTAALEACCKRASAGEKKKKTCERAARENGGPFSELCIERRSFSCTMSSNVTVRTRKFIRNALLARRQMVS